MNLRNMFFAVLVSIVGASRLDAATVTYTMYQDRQVPNGPAAPGKFVVTAKVSPSNDNGSLSGYGMDLQGGILTLNHMSPRDASADTATMSGPAGFTFARSADNQLFIAGFQDTSNADVIPVYGFGFEDSSFALKGITVGGANVEQVDWDAELILAVGTYTGNRPRFNQNGPNRTANVFVSTTSSQVRAPEQTTFVDATADPEPASLIILAQALVGMGAAGRRRLNQLRSLMIG